MSAVVIVWQGNIRMLVVPTDGPVVPPVRELCIAAGVDVSARPNHIRREGELLAVEHKHTAVHATSVCILSALFLEFPDPLLLVIQLHLVLGNFFVVPQDVVVILIRMIVVNAVLEIIDLMIEMNQ